MNDKQKELNKFIVQYDEKKLENAFNEYKEKQERQFHIMTVGEYKTTSELVENLNFKEGDKFGKYIQHETEKQNAINNFLHTQL